MPALRATACAEHAGLSVAPALRIGSCSTSRQLAELELRVEVRIARQHVLSRDQPLDLTVVIEESVLRRRFGSNSVMRQQLDRLAESSDLPNVQYMCWHSMAVIRPGLIV
jgi:hypothetical protein